MGHEVSQFVPLDPDLEAENDCCWFWFELMGSCCDCSCRKPVQLEMHYCQSIRRFVFCLRHHSGVVQLYINSSLFPHFQFSSRCKVGIDGAVYNYLSNIKLGAWWAAIGPIVAGILGMVASQR